MSPVTVLSSFGTRRDSFVTQTNTAIAAAHHAPPSMPRGGGRSTSASADGDHRMPIKRSTRFVVIPRGGGGESVVRDIATTGRVRRFTAGRGLLLLLTTTTTITLLMWNASRHRLATTAMRPRVISVAAAAVPECAVGWPWQRCSSSRSSSTYPSSSGPKVRSGERVPWTPAEAGARAEALARTPTSDDPSLHSVPLSLSTLLSHSGIGDASIALMSNTPQSPPLYLATTYTRPADGVYSPTDAIYTREDNPTRRALEACVAQLECHPYDPCRTALPAGTATPSWPVSPPDDDNLDVSTMSSAFASGMMAISSVLLAHRTPLHVILPTDCYHGVPTVLHQVFLAFGGGRITVETVDLSDANSPAALAEALTAALARRQLAAETTPGDTIVWMETPSNPRCQVIDVAEVCRLVEQFRAATTTASSHSSSSSSSDVPHRMTTVVDSTLAPPPLSQPLHWGVDVVIHSGTKYLGGHSDLLLGLATCSPWTAQGRLLMPRLRLVQSNVGGVAAPMDCWLALRGMRTLDLRVRQQSATALRLAQFLDQQRESRTALPPLVTQVYYPGLSPSSVTQRQMPHGLYGGVLSVEMVSEHHAMALAGALTTIQRATSLGGTETLIEHRQSIEPPERQTSPPGLLRISVGLEDADDLIRDLQQALDIVRQVCEGGGGGR